MEINIERIENNNNKIVILHVEGNLIGANNNILNDTLTKLIDKEEVNILINMNSVLQIDSYALGVLTASGNTIKEKDGLLKFAELQTFVQTLFNMMRMNDIFEIFDTVDEAVKSFE